MATQKNKAAASEPAAEKAAAVQEAATELICRKSAIQVGDRIFKFGDKVSAEEVAELPQRLHRWFEDPDAE